MATTQIILGSSIPLLQGAIYRARVRLSGAESVFGTKGALQSKFEDLGFAGVKIFGNVNDLPPDWPADQRTIATGDLESGYFAEGSWTKPNDTLPRPEEIVAIWMHKGPPAVSVDYKKLAVQARSELLLAWAFEFPDTSPDAQTLQSILAIGYFEGKWGFPSGDPSWVGSNNWGAVQDAASNLRTGKPSASEPQPDCGPTAFAHVDHDANGKAYWACFRKYVSMREGARDLIRTLHRMPRAWGAIDSGSATKLAYAMHADRYFELDPSEYAKRLAAAAKTVAALTGDALVVKYKKGGGWLWVFGFGLAGVGSGGWWWYQSRGARR